MAKLYHSITVPQAHSEQFGIGDTKNIINLHILQNQNKAGFRLFCYDFISSAVHFISVFLYSNKNIYIKLSQYILQSYYDDHNYLKSISNIYIYNKSLKILPRVMQKSSLTIAVLLLCLISMAYAQADYTDTVNKLKTAIQDKAGKFYHGAYNKLAQISDTYGPRMWGSQTLENVIVNIYTRAKADGFDNVRLQAVKNFTKWVRGHEQLWLHDPRPVPTPLKVIGLGGSVPGNVKANAIVVSNYDELDKVKDQVKGKIVVFNAVWNGYGPTVDYRVYGASHAAKYGASAALIRSVTPTSIQSVHTGIMHYDSNYPKIPVAAISTQDAQMLARMQARKQTILLQLSLFSYQVPNTYSNNVVFQIKGSTIPQQIILMGGHIDSWDTGSQTGANDDAGGFLTCYQALRLIKDNGFRAKRTLRFIAWSGQQWGGVLNGAHAYLLAHKEELRNHILAFQDDLGSTQLLGFGYLGHAEGKAIVAQVSQKYMGLINAADLTDDGGAADTGPLAQIGIPTMANEIKDSDNGKHEFYFTYHHSAGDSMTMMNADEMDSNVLGVACMFYIIADLDASIPKPKINEVKLEQILGSISAASRPSIRRQ